MSDLISRQAARNAVKNLGEDYVARLKMLLLIEELPSAEPERKTGKWLPHPHEREWDVCSVCGTGCKRREFEMQFGQEKFTEYGYRYCPFCGAEMTR